MQPALTRKKLQQYARNNGIKSLRMSSVDRSSIYQRDKYICIYCDREAGCLDHIIPRRAGGTGHPFNLISACNPCNYSKSTQIGGLLISKGWSYIQTLYENIPELRFFLFSQSEEEEKIDEDARSDTWYTILCCACRRDVGLITNGPLQVPLYCSLCSKIRERILNC